MSFTSFKKSVKRGVRHFAMTPRRLTADQRKLPDFIIIGTQKGGTSSLFYYLTQHPELEMAWKKEIHYFSKKYFRGIKWYKSFFPMNKRGKLTGESSPYYIFHPDSPHRIKKDLPNVKLIVMLRDPIMRAYSHYQMMRRKGEEKIDTFEKAIQAETERLESKNKNIKTAIHEFDYNHMKFSYLSRGFYAEQLKVWFEIFERDRFHFIKSENFFENPETELNRLCDFLGISHYLPPDLKTIKKGKYPPMEKETFENLKSIFGKDAEKLVSMISPEFRWF